MNRQIQCRVAFISTGFLLLLSLGACDTREDDCLNYYQCICGTDRTCLEFGRQMIMQSQYPWDACEDAYQVHIQNGGTCRDENGQGGMNACFEYLICVCGTSDECMRTALDSLGNNANLDEESCRIAMDTYRDSGKECRL